jgi:exonuclease VII large subunit
MERPIRVRLDDCGDRVHEASITCTASVVNPPFGPESAFERGFSITLDTRGKIIRSVKEVAPGDEIRTKLKDGEIRSTRQ